MKNLKFIVPLLFIILVVCCCQDAANELPKFDPVTVNENVIHLQDDNEDYNHKIILVDTSTDKILHTYVFKGYNIYDSHFDYSFAKKVFIQLIDRRYLELDISSGKVRELPLDFKVESSFIFDNQLWIFPVQRMEKGEQTKVIKYDKNMKSYWDTFKEGISYGDNTQSNDNCYITYHSALLDFYGILNYTKDTAVDISEIQTYGKCPYVGGNYLWFIYDNPNLSYNRIMNDIFKINSFEPLSYEKIMTTPSEWNVCLSNIYETSKDMFLYCGEAIFVIDKDTKQLKHKINLPEYKYVSFSHCRNGSIWCCAERSDGVYKFNMSDYSLKVIH